MTDLAARLPDGRYLRLIGLHAPGMPIDGPPLFHAVRILDLGLDASFLAERLAFWSPLDADAREAVLGDPPAGGGEIEPAVLDGFGPPDVIACLGARETDWLGAVSVPVLRVDRLLPNLPSLANGRPDDPVARVLAPENVSRGPYHPATLSAAIHEAGRILAVLLEHRPLDALLTAGR
ncbi:hypothetical protein AA12717_1691 [Gluconacetobacter sacchari DSM 12717]|uniref:Uncharacterized protein n=2 Tax=Gluconacetobacter sacchari TaxID=92759 RepID=A0A7W4NNY8_9PROT|nr:hypothetical protein [Gluconacetobacter sacchari]MBB2161202.1 hypothetical protein [Gluconacetobacter sacchari]GBQ24103.1 hypothetical protein AA12717_1691 [Gluconacetobacter sacchari DSM 12717]